MDTRRPKKKKKLHTSKTKSKTKTKTNWWRVSWGDQSFKCIHLCSRTLTSLPPRNFKDEVPLNLQRVHTVTQEVSRNNRVIKRGDFLGCWLMISLVTSRPSPSPPQLALLSFTLWHINRAFKTQQCFDLQATSYSYHNATLKLTLKFERW